MTIHISRLTIETVIGILDFEREKTQNLVLDIDIGYKYKNGKFLNYADIVQDITKDIQTKQYKLLEDAIIGLKNILIIKYPEIKTLHIKATKPDILKNCHVGLSKTWNF